MDDGRPKMNFLGLSHGRFHNHRPADTSTVRNRCPVGRRYRLLGNINEEEPVTLTEPEPNHRKGPWQRDSHTPSFLNVLVLESNTSDMTD
jgi:hypothetical protein